MAKVGRFVTDPRAGAYCQITLDTGEKIVVPRTVFRCLGQYALWPWGEFDPYLAIPLRGIRRQFGIRVAHGNAKQ